MSKKNKNNIAKWIIVFVIIAMLAPIVFTVLSYL